MTPKFKRYPSDPSKPLEVYGSDGGLLVVRVHLDNVEMMKELAQAVKDLPRGKNREFKGIKRSDYLTVHLGCWAAYSKECMVSKELRELGVPGLEFLEKHQHIWGEMSRVLGQYVPGVFKKLQLYELNEPCKRFCGAWTMCAVNNGGDDATETKAHRDVKEYKKGYSCIISCGDYSGGALVLFELGIVVEMKAGDIILFPDSLITHCNEKAEGNRISIVSFTQKNVYDYWARKYNMEVKKKGKKNSI